MLTATPYEGRADHPWPPAPLGWAEVPWDDADARRQASALLGQLPAYHYVDETRTGGLYRFFTFETPIGEAVGALRFVGEKLAGALMGAAPVTRVVNLPFPNQGTFAITDAALNQAFVVNLPDGATWQSALAANDVNASIGSAPSQGNNPAGFTFNTSSGSTSLTANWIDKDNTPQQTVITVTSASLAAGGGGGGGNTSPEAPPATVAAGATTVTPVAYTSLAAAAVAMNTALSSHGYRRSDQPIYLGFQQANGGGLALDAFPGTQTMHALAAALAALSPPVPMANVPIYPWLSSGQYDGVNAPTWAQWTGGGGATPTPTVKPSSSNAGVIVALGGLAALVVGVVAKSSGALGRMYG